MKFALVIPDGVAIRNFLCTRFIDLLLERGQVHVWHALSECTINPYKQRFGAKVHWEVLPNFREGLPERVLRQAKIFAQLYWHYDHDAAEVTLQRLRPVGLAPRRIVSYLAHEIGRRSASASGVARLDRLHARLTLGASYISSFVDTLYRERPDVVLCTHQRASRAVPAMLAAQRLGIPTATFIYSWDNLPKGRMAVHADYYLVWSEFMRNELLRYYPEISAGNVHVAGTPQFEHYYNPALIQPRDQFLDSVGLDPQRPVVCFSGDDVSTSPFDPMYLADLAEAMRKLPASERPQIIFRRCPVDRSNRYQSVLERYPEIAVSEPKWADTGTGDWTQTVPTMEDIALLANIATHCDLVVNLGSTMAMDFAIFNKPGIYLAYDPPSLDGCQSVHEIYRLPHFRCVHDLQPVYWVRSALELGEQVQRALSQPGEKQAAREAWVRLQVCHPMDQASERCCNALLQIAKQDNPECISPSSPASTHHYHLVE